MKKSDFDFYNLMQDAYSFERPAYIVGNALLNGMIEAGLTKKQALTVFYSKTYRWALDGEMGDAIDTLARVFARKWARESKGQAWIDDDLPDNLQEILDAEEDNEYPTDESRSFGSQFNGRI